MSIKTDLLNLSSDRRRRLRKIILTIMKRNRNVHTIIIDKIYSDKRAVCCRYFEIFVFMERDENSHLCKESFSRYGFYFNNQSILNNSRCYRQTDRFPSPEEAEALCCRNREVSSELREDYLNFLNRNLHHFKYTVNKTDFPRITTINSAEMQEDSTRFFNLYTTHRAERGYIIYDRRIKPLYSLGEEKDVQSIISETEE